eukprot:1063018-Pyramimonas_sp.AAC.1
MRPHIAATYCNLLRLAPPGSAARHRAASAGLRGWAREYPSPTPHRLPQAPSSSLLGSLRRRSAEG